MEWFIFQPVPAMGRRGGMPGSGIMAGLPKFFARWGKLFDNAGCLVPVGEDDHDLEMSGSALRLQQAIALPSLVTDQHFTACGIS
jgi:hypothetical protein